MPSSTVPKFANGSSLRRLANEAREYARASDALLISDYGYGSAGPEVWNAVRANRRLNGVHVNDMQNNPLQPDINYRGFTASPLLGTPQGLSVYLDGVRLNQPFGDVVSWE